MNAHNSARTFHLLGNLITFRAWPADTGDTFALAEIITAPGAGAPPNHHVEEESFLVIDGEVEFVVEGEARRCRPGDFMKIPTDRVHAFTNVGDTPSRMINLTLPGHDHAGFFSTAGEEQPAGATGFPAMTAPDVPTLLAIGAKYNIHLLPPPGAGE